MRNTKKILVAAVCALLLVSLIVAGTVAYLLDTKSTKNTFTVGDVKITLANAIAETDAIHLVPGSTYAINPTVTVDKDSESCYVRVLVKVSAVTALKEALGDDYFDDITSDVDSTWTKQASLYTEDTEADTATYELRLNDVVAKSTSDTALAIPFTNIDVPNTLTNAQITAIKNAGLEIEIFAQAIQSANLENANVAWAAFDAQVNG